MKNLIAAALLILSLGSIPTAHARAVRIEWSAVQHSVKYELRILRDRAPLRTETLASNTWKGGLDPGFYTYQVRAIDFAGRPSEWSDPSPLVVLRRPPIASAPKNGTRTTLYSRSANVVLKWEGSEDSSSYRVEVRSGSRVAVSQVVHGTQLALPGLDTGSYAWTVRAVVTPPREAAAQFPGVPWESAPNEPLTFEIRQATLSAPVMISPVGVRRGADQSLMDFAWQSVSGAEAYELWIGQETPSRKELLSKTLPAAAGHSLTIRMPGEGTYSWRVRALAHLDETGKALASSPVATAAFTLDPEAMFTDGSGNVAVSLMPQKYSYQLAAPGLPPGSSSPATAFSLRTAGEYWFRPSWAGAVGVQETFFKLNQRNDHRTAVELLAKHRFNLSGDRYGWYLIPKLGLELREYFDILSDPFPASGSGGLSLDARRHRITWGPLAGLDLRKQFDEEWSLGARINYYLPVGMLGASSGYRVRGPASRRNLSVGLEGLHWFSRRVGVGLGGFMDLRSIGYSPKAPGPSTGLVEITTDSVNAFLSVLFRFGG